MDGDTFLLQKRSAQVGIGPPEGAKADVCEKANEFCKEKGLCVETVDFDMVNTHLGRPGSVALQFRCVECEKEKIAEDKKMDKIADRIEALNELKDKELISEEEYTKKKAEILNEL